MKKTEMKNLAKQIARAEQTLQESSDETEIANAEMTILRLSNRVTSLEEMLMLDDLIQEIMKKS